MLLTKRPSSLRLTVDSAKVSMGHPSSSSIFFVSLDSLYPDRFRNITGKGNLGRVLHGIDAALNAGFERIKLNTVNLKHRNHDEIQDLVQFAVDKGINISFVEEMPVGRVGDHDRTEAFYSSDQIKADLRSRFELVPTAETTGGPARYYRIPGIETRVGFISPAATTSAVIATAKESQQRAGCCCAWGRSIPWTCAESSASTPATKPCWTKPSPMRCGSNPKDTTST